MKAKKRMLASESTSNEMDEEASASSATDSVVYMTTDISPDGLMAVYKALDWTPSGNVAVKLSTSEPPASNYLRPELIADLVKSVDGTIVECNTAYGGSRAETAMHYQVAEDHGFTVAAPALPVRGAASRMRFWNLWQKDGDGASLVNRIESRNGLHTLEHAEAIGLGSRAYELISIERHF